jgi:D-alanyl-D-alanine carboxypeptidase/D-alanyl-D-alanine-endopeptidase (penicillin-binding protein 4)
VPEGVDLVGRARRWTAGVAVATVLVGGLGYAAADAYDVVPGVLTTAPRPTPPPPFPVAPGAAERSSAAPEVLPAVDTDAPLPAPDALSGVLAPLLAAPPMGPSVGVVVADALTGQVLFDAGGATPREPASVAKLLTAAAALARLGPDVTVSTRAVAGGTPDEVVLVGGGDVLLAAGAGNPDAANGRAGLGDLAAATAAALRRQGRSTVAVRVDDSLFSGPGTAPGWSPADVGLGFVAPVTAVAVDAGRLRPERYAPRAPDPALAAAAAFADGLRAEGIQVAGDVARTVAPAGARVLGEVTSAPLSEVVSYLLASSDNTAAESLARLVARGMGRPAAFADSARAVLDEVALLGLDVRGAILADGSGLSEGSAVPARLLTDVLVAAASPDHPDLRALVTGLPVAGLNGTLLERFAGSAAGVGVVRAKTGSLMGVSSLAGTVRDADGRLLVFAVLADAVPAAGPARAAIDAVAAALAGCGCR